MIKKLLPYAKSNFARKVSTLFSANIITHLITFFNLTILSRIFSLEDVGQYSVLLSYVTIVGNYCLLSYHVAIQTSDEKHFSHFVTGSIFVLLVISLLSYICLILMSVSYPQFITMLIILAGINLIADSINIRNGEMYKISIRKIIQPFIQLIYLGLCYFAIQNAATFQNLIYVVIMSQLISAFLFGGKIIKAFNLKLGISNIYNVMLARFKRSSTLSISDIFNTLAYNVPTILIEKFFGSVYAGFYSMIMRICSIPITLISDAVAKVYLNITIKETTSNSNKISYTNFKMLNLFMVVSTICGFIFIMLTLTPVVQIVLGDHWLESAKIGLILSPVFCLGYMVTPLSMLFYTLQKEHALFKVQLLYLVISLASFGIGILVNDIYVALYIFSIASSIRYLYIYYSLVNFAKKHSF